MIKVSACVFLQFGLMKVCVSVLCSSFIKCLQASEGSRTHVELSAVLRHTLIVLLFYLYLLVLVGFGPEAAADL